MNRSSKLSLRKRARNSVQLIRNGYYYKKTIDGLIDTGYLPSQLRSFMLFEEDIDEMKNILIKLQNFHIKGTEILAVLEIEEPDMQQQITRKHRRQRQTEHQTCQTDMSLINEHQTNESQVKKSKRTDKERTSKEVETQTNTEAQRYLNNSVATFSRATTDITSALGMLKHYIGIVESEAINPLGECAFRFPEKFFMDIAQEVAYKDVDKVAIYLDIPEAVRSYAKQNTLHNSQMYLFQLLVDWQRTMSNKDDVRAKLENALQYAGYTGLAEKVKNYH
ncbi:unnamed protein product [Owenia fusiformis]|uniref:Death domain-containing protein n=1 Tax=Owenia fusiformis TaxID=6347 RepID=A0A8S4Q6J7_OWEFU|nr:unnamed protein product [Owenia fusiformis]